MSDCVHIVTGEPTEAHVRQFRRVADRLEPIPGPDRLGPCLVWIGATNEAGYGFLKVDGERRLVHRIVAEAVCGTDLPDLVLVDHRCGQLLCCNWLHLDLVVPR